METSIKRVETQVQHVRACSQDIKARIHESFQAIHKVLEEREAAVVTSLVDLTTMKVRDLEHQKTELCRTLDGVRMAIAFSETLVQEGTDIHLLNQQKTVMARLAEVGTPVATSSSGSSQASSFSEIGFFSEDKAVLDAIGNFGQVDSNEASPRSTVERDMLACHPVSRPYSFNIAALNKWGERLSFGQDAFEASAVNKATRAEQPVQIHDSNNGSYVAKLVVAEAGQYDISVRIHGSHIQGSPFEISFIPRDYTSITNNPPTQLCVSDIISPSTMKEVTDENLSPVESPSKQIPFSKGFCLGPNRSFIFTDTTSHGIYRTTRDTVLLNLVRQGNTQGHFNSPKAVAYNNNSIFVADTNNNRVQILTVDGAQVGSVGSKGTAPGQFLNPQGLAIGANHTLVVADTNNNRIQFFQNLTYKDTLGSVGSQPGQFLKPWGVAVNKKNELIVADSGNHRVQMFDLTTNKFIRSFGTQGSKTGDFDCPSQVAVDSYDNIFVCDTNNRRVQIFDPMGRHVHSVPTKIPFGVGVWDDGVIVVAECNFGGSFISEY